MLDGYSVRPEISLIYNVNEMKTYGTNENERS